MQPPWEPRLGSDRQRGRRRGGIDHVQHPVEDRVRAPRAVEPTDDHARPLRRPGVVEDQPPRDLARLAQPEQRGAGAQAQLVEEHAARPVDHRRPRLDRRIGQQRTQQREVRAVVPRGRQAGAEAVVPAGPVEPVEPVPRVVAVAVHRLGPQQLPAGMEIRHPLAQRVDAQGDGLGAGAVLGAGGARQLQHQGVEQRLVVVVLDVVDDLGRHRRITGRLVAVGQALAGDEPAVGGR